MVEMTPSLPHWPFILGSYLFAVVSLGLLIIMSALKKRQLARRLARLDEGDHAD